MNTLIKIGGDYLVRAGVGISLEARDLIVLSRQAVVDNYMRIITRNFIRRNRDGRTSLSTFSVMNPNGAAGLSPFISSIPSNFILSLANRGGVPVFKRPSLNPPVVRREFESDMEAGSSILPNGVCVKPNDGVQR